MLIRLESSFNLNVLGGYSLLSKFGILILSASQSLNRILFTRFSSNLKNCEDVFGPIQVNLVIFQ